MKSLAVDDARVSTNHLVSLPILSTPNIAFGFFPFGSFKSYGGNLLTLYCLPSNVKSFTVSDSTSVPISEN